MITEASVRAALETVIDPCSRAAGCATGLDSLGLVRRVALAPRADGLVDVQVVIGVTEYGCLMGAPFASEAYKRLEALAGVGAVEVALDDQFDWDRCDMSPAYTRRLAEHRAAQGIPVVVHRRSEQR
jgi:metal-sulfur cluster biosynthetic enzyme